MLTTLENETAPLLLKSIEVWLVVLLPVSSFMFSNTSAVPTTQTPSVVKPIPTNCDFDILRWKNTAESILVKTITDPEKKVQALFRIDTYL